MDITASILAATGTRGPANHRLDGVDVLPILRGRAPVLERRVFWRWSISNRQQRAVRSGQWKLLIDGNQLLLFDVRVDPGERRDLAGRHPDVVARLKRLMNDWEADVDRSARAQ